MNAKFTVIDPAIRFTGRWSVPNEKSATATAPGSYFEIAYRGTMLVLHFDMFLQGDPLLRLWISIDNGIMTESALAPFLRVQTKDDGIHIARIVFKSSAEQHNRWYTPLQGKVTFTGFDADATAALPPDNRPTIEFVGDSITEGVLVDEGYTDPYVYVHGQNIDDVAAGYAYLTAEALNLRPLMMGYGAVGVTRGGNGGVPRAPEAYPFCFANTPVAYASPDYIVVNHGANDRSQSPDVYIAAYIELLDVIRAVNPTSELIVLSPFCGSFANELAAMVEAYNKAHNDSIFYINTVGWVPPTPLHPGREGHRILAKHLSESLKAQYPLL